MKKKLAILISLMMVMSFSFAACGGNNVDLSDSEYVGEWVCNSMTAGDESGDVEGGVWTLTLNGDGTGKFVSTEADGTEETDEITWELTDEGFKTKGDTKLKFAKEDSGIKTSLMGVELHFVRPGEESSGDDAASENPAELAVYKYMEETIAKDYSPGEYSVAYGTVVAEEESDDGIALKGSFYIDNYNLEGDTLKFVSGGSHPGCFHLKKNEDGSYEVTSFDAVGDGSEFEPTAKEIFGDAYEDFMKVYSNDELNKETRTEAVSNYVKKNGIAATKYQDEGWDPVDLNL